MRYNININQKAVIDLGYDLDLIDCALLEYLHFFCNSKSKKIIRDENGKSWLDLKKLILDMPLLKINNSEVIGRRIKELRLKKFVIAEVKKVEGVNNRRLYIDVTEKLESLFVNEEDSDQGKVPTQGSTQVPTQTSAHVPTQKSDNNSIKDNYIKDRENRYFPLILEILKTSRISYGLEVKFFETVSAPPRVGFGIQESKRVYMLLIWLNQYRPNWNQPIELVKRLYFYIKDFVALEHTLPDPDLLEEQNRLRQLASQESSKRQQEQKLLQIEQDKKQREQWVNYFETVTELKYSDLSDNEASSIEWAYHHPKLLGAIEYLNKKDMNHLKDPLIKLRETKDSKSSDPG